ncbi:hypothetical protein FB45DRAFT_1041863 [Roridomyces roridus]|uniref:F-box domain-containing protein n=1 Tax=Roridomyces roridus TaxID=1738132 RepID=A0AAD7B077_9AGAR|nr:hypothetical protein FB45DRAFT_1041863 [Roridomyces roridus]
MGRAMPDEIIHEILSPALSISDDIFSARFVYSPSAPWLESSAAILLVCKAWLRVATPLLYHTVILRNKGQAQALSVVLHSNADLGRLVKKLRVDSRYGSSMHKILQQTKNLTDIFIPLQFKLGDNARGLCRGLPLIDPVRVLVDTGLLIETTVRPSHKALVDVVVEYIPKWKNLAIFEMPHDRPDSNLNETLSLPLKQAPNLRTLILSYNARALFRDGSIPHYISTIVQNTSLQDIRPKTRSRKALKPAFVETVQGNDRLRELIDPNLFGPKTGFAPQLAGNPKVADVIWDRVLYYVFCEDHDESHDEYWEDGDSDYEFDDEGNRIEHLWDPLLVCKQFLRLGTAHFYSHDIYIWTCKSMRLLTEHLLDQPSLGAHVRRLILSTGDEQTTNDLQNLFSQIPHLTELSSVKALTLPWLIFDELSLRYGSHLELFYPNPIVFHRLSRMQYFFWKSDTEFDTTDMFTASNGFTQLKYLTVARAHPSFFIILSQMQLHSLSTVTLHTENHMGSPTLNADNFNYCANVKYLSVWIASKDELSVVEGVLQQCDTHSFLEHMAIDLEGFDAQSKLLDVLAAFLTKFDCTPFPTLREIELRHFDWQLLR